MCKNLYGCFAVSQGLPSIRTILKNVSVFQECNSSLGMIFKSFLLRLDHNIYFNYFALFHCTGEKHTNTNSMAQFLICNLPPVINTFF